MSTDTPSKLEETICRGTLLTNSMKSLNPSPETCRLNGVISLGLIPGNGPATLRIKVSHGLDRYEVALPSNSSFGYLKSVLCQNIGLKPETYKLFFGGVEKEDGADLQNAGVMNNSELFLIEVTEHGQKSPEEVHRTETSVVSKGEEAVAEVRREVDKLAQQVSALQAVVDSGNKVDDKEIVYLTEMLMRQLLKLDGIEAEGEGRVQRKMGVRWVQGIVEALDALKSRNSNSFSNAHRDLPKATEQRASDFGCECKNTSSEEVYSNAHRDLRKGTEQRASDSGCQSQNTPSEEVFTPSASYPVSHFTPTPIPSYPPLSMPHFTPSTFSATMYCSPAPMQYFDPSTLLSSTPHPVPYYDPSHMSYFTPPTPPYPTSSPMPYFVHPHGPMPYYYPSAALSAMPTFPKVTQHWERFE